MADLTSQTSQQLTNKGFQTLVNPGLVPTEIVGSHPLSAGLQSSLKSLLITGTSVAAGFLVMMSTDAAANLHTPGDVVHYVQGHILGFLVATLVAPLWRGSNAYRAAARMAQ